MINKDKIEILISHSGTDKDFAECLFKELTNDQTSVFLDKYSIKTGELIPEKINKSIDICHFFLLILSQSAIESQWVKLEYNAAFMRALSTGDPIIIPILYKDCKIPTLLTPLKYVDFRDTTNFQNAISALKDRIGLNFIGDDNRYRDEKLFNMPNQKRKEIFGKILNERKTMPKYRKLDERCSQALQQYEKRDYYSEFSSRAFYNARIFARHFLKSVLLPGTLEKAHVDKESYVISVCGFPGLGKTTFSRELQLAVASNNLTCTIIEFEKWMKNRSERWSGTNNVVSGFDPDSFHYDQLVEAVNNIVIGRPIKLPLRNEGERVSSTTINPADFLILDGVLSFFDDFYQLSEFNIFFDADLATKYLLSSLKDSFVRQYDINKIDSKFHIHDRTYPTFIQTLKNRADLIIITNPYHNYKYFISNKKL